MMLFPVSVNKKGETLSFDFSLLYLIQHSRNLNPHVQTDINYMCIGRSHVFNENVHMYLKKIVLE